MNLSIKKETNILNFRRLYRFYLIIFSIIFLGSGCSPTKHVPENNYLLDKVKVNIDPKKTIAKEGIKKYIRQLPNKKIAGFKFHLSLYNLASVEKNKGFNKWLKNIGEQPVLYDPLMTEKTSEQISLYLINKGFRNASINPVTNIRKNKVLVDYRITLNQPFRIDSITYSIPDSTIASIIIQDSSNSLIRHNSLFDLEVLENERIRIENVLKQKGYFDFNRNMIYYPVDTSLGNKKVTLTLAVQYPTNNSQEEDSILCLNKYYFNKIYIHLNYDQRNMLAQNEEYLNSLDTITFDSITFIYKDKLYIRPNRIKQSLYIEKDSIYNILNVDETYKHLASLRLFKLINIRFNPLTDSLNKNNGLLDCYILLTPFAYQSYSTELEGTNSSGDLGIATNIGYQHKNLFNGSEILSFNVRGAIEAMKKRYADQLDNTIEFGSELRIRFPVFMLPINSQRFVKKYNPKTTVSTSYNYQRRPDYTRTIANFSFGYTWKGSKNITHNVYPFDINIVYLPPSDQLSAFLTRIDGTYLENSYKNQLIPVSSYNLIFNNQVIDQNSNFLFMRWGVETAGNTLTSFFDAMGKEKENGYYKLLGLRYAQFFKTDIDIRYYMRLNKTDKIVYRVFSGIGIPYNNSEAIPFEKRYFSGGANSLRAWQVRTLGPGSYNVAFSPYPNSLGDIKLEANLEYRFDLFWVLEGAFFVDAGNIWAISDVEERSGALFKTDRFLNDIAVGTGLGTRFDFSFFIFRLDMGIKTRDPAFIQEQKWIFGNRKLTKNDYNFVVGIGYPF